MTALSINRRPVPFIAAAAAVAAIAAGSLALSVSHETPGPQPPISVGQDTSSAHHFQPTTSGGRVMLGQ